MKKFFFIGMAFLMGCAANQAVKNMIPELKANQQNVQKLEYFCGVTSGFGIVGHAKDMHKIANKFGVQGWELATRHSGEFCFKRKL